MADLLIKGMEMPIDCADCDLHNPFSETPYCRRLLQVIPLEGRLDNCPLVEVEETKRIGVNGEWETIYQEARS